MCSTCLCYQKYSENVLLRWVRQCHFYNKTNQMHNISNLLYFGTTLYLFRTVFPSIIRSLRLYIQHQVYVRQVLFLLASGNEMEHLHFTSSKLTDTNIVPSRSTDCKLPDDGLIKTETRRSNCYIF
jgi:hypothetical protein